MTEVNVVSTPASSGVKLGLGPYAYSELSILPDWYLAHLLAGVADPKWSQLTGEQQAAVVAENKRRHPDDDSQAGGPAAVIPAASVSPLQPLTEAGVAGAAPGSVPHTRESDETILAGTVAEVSEYVAKVSNITELDALSTVEEAGKKRAGVFSAIEKRRAELVAAAAASSAPVPEA